MKLIRPLIICNLHQTRSTNGLVHRHSRTVLQYVIQERNVRSQIPHNLQPIGHAIYDLIVLRQCPFLGYFSSLPFNVILSGCFSYRQLEATEGVLYSVATFASTRFKCFYNRECCYHSCPEHNMRRNSYLTSVCS